MKETLIENHLKIIKGLETENIFVPTKRPLKFLLKKLSEGKLFGLEKYLLKKKHPALNTLQETKKRLLDFDTQKKIFEERVLSQNA